MAHPSLFNRTTRLSRRCGSLTSVVSVLTVVFALGLAGCESDEGDGGGTDTAGEKYGIFTVVSDTEATVRGDLTNGVDAKFREMMTAHPGITQLTLVFVGGSSVSERTINGKVSDDGMELGREVYKRGMHTHVPDKGLVASGGTDLFASGKTTSYAGELGGPAECDLDVPTKTCLGVHSWGGGWDENPKGTGWDIKDDKDHAQHDKYLEYFKDIGVDEAFYFYTIGAAKAGGMAYMTHAEYETYLKR